MHLDANYCSVFLRCGEKNTKKSKIGFNGMYLIAMEESEIESCFGKGIFNVVDNTALNLFFGIG